MTSMPSDVPVKPHSMLPCRPGYQEVGVHDDVQLQVHVQLLEVLEVLEWPSRLPERCWPERLGRSDQWPLRREKGSCTQAIQKHDG